MSPFPFEINLAPSRKVLAMVKCCIGVDGHWINNCMSWETLSNSKWSHTRIKVQWNVVSVFFYNWSFIQQSANVATAQGEQAGIRGITTVYKASFWHLIERNNDVRITFCACSSCSKPVNHSSSKSKAPITQWFMKHNLYWIEHEKKFLFQIQHCKTASRSHEHVATIKRLCHDLDVLLGMGSTVH